MAGAGPTPRFPFLDAAIVVIHAFGAPPAPLFAHVQAALSIQAYI